MPVNILPCVVFPCPLFHFVVCNFSLALAVLIFSLGNCMDTFRKFSFFGEVELIAWRELGLNMIIMVIMMCACVCNTRTDEKSIFKISFLWHKSSKLEKIIAKDHKGCGEDWTFQSCLQKRGIITTCKIIFPRILLYPIPPPPKKKKRFNKIPLLVEQESFHCNELHWWGMLKRLIFNRHPTCQVQRLCDQRTTAFCKL